MAVTSKTIVLITGANQGLGYECVKKLAAEQQDYHIILCSRDPIKGKSATDTITKFATNTTVEPLELDVLSDSSIEEAVKYIDAHHGRLDVLFHNAGIGGAGQPEIRQEMLKVYETNTVSTVCVTEAFVPLLKKAEVPRIAFMSSSLGSITYTLTPFFPYYGLDNKAYLTSKAAMDMVAAQYAVKYGKEGFKVNVFCPGWRATNITSYDEKAGDAKDGIIEVCRILTSGKDGPHATFTASDGTLIPW